MRKIVKYTIKIPGKILQLCFFLVVAIFGIIFLGGYQVYEQITEWIKYKYCKLRNKTGGKEWHFINEYDFFDTYSIVKRIPWHEDYRWFYSGTFVECYEARRNYMKEALAQSEKEKAIRQQPTTTDNFFNNIEFDDYIEDKKYYF